MHASYVYLIGRYASTIVHGSDPALLTNHVHAGTHAADVLQAVFFMLTTARAETFLRYDLL